MSLLDDLERIASVAAAAAPDGAAVSAVLASEPAPGVRGYLCAFEDAGGSRSWLVLDDAGAPVTRREEARDVVAIAALCEIAEESSFGSDLDELLSQLVAVRLTERPPGIEEAEEAVRALQRAIGTPPQLATPARLDDLGGAIRRLERALDPVGASPFTAALKSAQGAVEELWRDVEHGYLVPLG